VSGTTLVVAGGGEVDRIVLGIEGAYPTVGDLLLAAQVMRSRILARTEFGLDVDDQPFAGYNTTRPFYYYPSGPVGKNRSDTQLRRDRSKVSRFAKKVGRTKGAITGSKLGLKFPSYDAFKRTYLERPHVDLRGPRAPHMLQQIVARAGGAELGEQDQNIGLEDHPQLADEFTLGIYGEAAERAAAHNSSTGRPPGMPRRHFFGSNEGDKGRLVSLIVNRIAARAQRKLQGK